MSTETNQDGGAPEKGAEGEETKVEVISVPKGDYDKLQETIGSMKRELKDLKKAAEPVKEAPKSEKTESSELGWGQKAFLKASGLNTAEEMALAKDFEQRTGEPLEKVLEDDVFKGKLDKLRTTNANALAAEGNSGRGNQAGRDTVEYHLAKLGPNDPIPSDLPREMREKLVDARRNQGKDKKMFYND